MAEIVNHHGEVLRVDPDVWHCPRCNTSAHPVEQPNGTFCFNCRLKLETCCEGAPLPDRPQPR